MAAAAAAAARGSPAPAAPGEGMADWEASPLREASLSAVPALGVVGVGGPQVFGLGGTALVEAGAVRAPVETHFVGLLSRAACFEDQVLDSGTVAPPSRGGVRLPAVAGGPALARGRAGGVGASAPALLARPPVAGPLASVGAEVG